MTKLKGILLTEGMHGMISQVEGLAKALDLDFTHHKVELNSFWKLFPPKLTPVAQSVFKKINLNEFDVIISCGRESVIPSIYLKKNEIEDNKNYLKDQLKENKEYFSLILGGPTKHYEYSLENIKNILEKFKKLLITNNLQGIVIPSMRTPKNIISFAKEFLGNENLVIEKVDKKAYLSALGLAKFISVTCDSTSMISEAALTGKPLYIAEIPTKKNDYRFKKFRDLFNRLNITKNLNEKLETWHYESLNETIRIAEEIKKKIN